MDSLGQWSGLTGDWGKVAEGWGRLHRPIRGVVQGQGEYAGPGGGFVLKLVYQGCIWAKNHFGSGGVMSKHGCKV